jgi:hypothetical protein
MGWKESEDLVIGRSNRRRIKSIFDRMYEKSCRHCNHCENCRRFIPNFPDSDANECGDYDDSDYYGKGTLTEKRFRRVTEDL